MRKILFYFSHIIKMARASKLRLFLLLLGITIGLFGYSFGTMCIDSYYDSLLREVEEMPDDTMYVSIDNEYENITRELVSSTGEMPLVERISSDNKLIYRLFTADGKETDVYGKLHGVSKVSDVYTLWDMKYGVNMSDITITEGRNFTGTEIQNNEKVCLIDEFTAELIFEGDAIGKQIQFNYWGETSGDNIAAYEVIGVYKDTYYSRKRRELRESQLAESDNAYVYADIICPYHYSEFFEEYDNPTVTYLWKKDDEIRKNIVNTITKVGIDYNFSPVTDRDYEMEIVEASLQNIKYAVNWVTKILLVITGIFSMSIMCFALKERAWEIGIKKAFGADSLDLIVQFVFEISFTVLIAASIAYGASVWALNMTSGYITDNLLSDYLPKYDVASYFKLLAIGLAQNLVFMLVPILIYSGKKVVKILKVD